MKVLLIEDDKNISEMTVYNLAARGVKTIPAYSVHEARRLLPGDFDAILLDLLLPDISGLEFIPEIKSVTDTPIVVLSALHGEIERVEALSFGARDYITKPFYPQELYLRLKAVARKQDEENPDFLMNPQRRSVKIKGGEEIFLTSTEYALLSRLFLRQGKVATRKELLSEVWNSDYDVDTRIVDVAITRLRKKLGEYGEKLIYTCHGLGYCLLLDNKL